MLLWWGWDNRQSECQKRLVLGWWHSCVRRGRPHRQYKDGPRDEYPHHTIDSLDSWLSRCVVVVARDGISIACIPGRVQNHETNAVKPQHVLDPDHELLAKLWIIPCVWLSRAVQTNSRTRKKSKFTCQELRQNWGGHEYKWVKQLAIATLWVVRITALKFVWLP